MLFLVVCLIVIIGFLSVFEILNHRAAKARLNAGHLPPEGEENPRNIKSFVKATYF